MTWRWPWSTRITGAELELARKQGAADAVRDLALAGHLETYKRDMTGVYTALRAHDGRVTLLHEETAAKFSKLFIQIGRLKAVYYFGAAIIVVMGFLGTFLSSAIGQWLVREIFLPGNP